MFLPIIRITFALVLLATATASATTRTVTNTSDNDPGSLRATIAAAASGDTINFDASVNGGTITLTSGELAIGVDLTINGPASSLLTISGNNASRVFAIAVGKTVTISNLTITQGTTTGAFPANSGGAIHNNGAALTLNNCVLTQSSALQGSAIFNNAASSASASLTLNNCTISQNTSSGGSGGGAVFSYAFSTSRTAALTVTNSTFSSNQAVSGASGGAIRTLASNSGSNAPVAITGSTFNGNSTSGIGGAIYAGGSSSGSAPVVLINSTFSGNSALAGGGVYALASGGSAPLTVSSCTFSDNSATNVNGGSTPSRNIYCSAGGNDATLSLENTILNMGSGSGPANVTSDGTVISRGHNLSSDSAGGFLTGSGDVVNTDPKLSSLGNYGGPTATYRLLPDSPANNVGASVTTLSGDVPDGSTTSINLADATAFPSAGGVVIQIGDEQMIVTAKSGNTLTVQRGANNTTAVGHLNGSAVNFATDQRGLPRLVGSAVDIGAVETNYAVAATSGLDQTATINTAFANNLQATVTESGSAVSGVTVTFSAPATGPSGAFGGSATQTTNSSGIATAPTFTANGTAGGPYNVTASLANNIASASFSLTNNKGDQTIAFASLPDKTYGAADFVVSATGGGSSSPVTFAATNNCTSSGTNGSTIHITGAGTCTVTASQAGDDNYNAAPDVAQSFNIAKATPVITWNKPSNITYGTALSSTQLNATTSVAGTFQYTPAAGTVLNAGTNQTLSVTFTPSNTANYNGASKNVLITVVKATPAITWANPADITYGTALTGTQLNATASVPGTFAYTPSAGTVLPPGANQTLSANFTPTDTTDYNSTSKSVSINVTAPSPTPTPTATPSATATASPLPTATTTPTATATPSAPTAQPLNISTRMEVLQDANVLIAGFIITGEPNATKKVMIRGLGPSLAKAGVPNPLGDPLLELHGPTGFATIVNDNWQETSNTSEIPDGFQPSDPHESVIVAVLSIGAQGFSNYTAILRGAHGETGIGLVEAYDLEPATSQFANISTRGFIDTGDNVMIGGFILGGSDAASKVLIRGIGASLADQRVTGVLADPTLEIHDADGNKIRSNDNWKIDDATGQSQQAAIEATTIPPASDFESAVLDTFPPGRYTAIVAGKDQGTGVGLVEAYNLKE